MAVPAVFRMLYPKAALHSCRLKDNERTASDAEPSFGLPLFCGCDVRAMLSGTRSASLSVSLLDKPDASSVQIPQSPCQSFLTLESLLSQTSLCDHPDRLLHLLPVTSGMAG